MSTAANQRMMLSYMFSVHEVVKRVRELPHAADTRIIT